jgi:plasmid maintenance system killer protein
MEVVFRTPKEQLFYESRQALSRKYGGPNATKIIQRIEQLRAAPTPQQLPASARFHEHKGARKGLFSLDLVHPKRLIVRPREHFESWVEIESVEIYEVMDPHY